MAESGVVEDVPKQLLAINLANRTHAVILRRFGDNNVLGYLHVTLVWMHHVTFLPGTGTRLRDEEATTLLSYFFCQAGDLRINNATAVLRGLIYMLLDQQPSLLPHLRKAYDHAGKALFEDANSWVALCEILTSILQDPILTSAYLITDALDECVTDRPKLEVLVNQPEGLGDEKL